MFRLREDKKGFCSGGEKKTLSALPVFAKKAIARHRLKRNHGKSLGNALIRRACPRWTTLFGIFDLRKTEN